MPRVFTLSIPCQTENLQTIREFVRANLDVVPIREKTAYQIVLAVDEACANAIIHGNNCDCNKRLKVVLELENDLVTAKISDTGNYDIDTPPNKKIIHEKVRTKAKGGLGLMIMQTLMDEISIIRNGEQYCCKMSKQIKET